MDEIDVSLPPIPPRLSFEDLTEEQFNELTKALWNFVWDHKLKISSHPIYYVIQECKDDVVKQYLIDISRPL